MTNFNFKFLGAWLVIVASITGLQAQNDFTFPPYRDIILCLQADD